MAVPTCSVYLPVNQPVEMIPVIFVPGIMASRLKSKKGDIIWDPDNIGWVFKSAFSDYKKIRKRVGVTTLPEAELIDNDPSRKEKPDTRGKHYTETDYRIYNDDQLKRGFGKCFSGYQDILKYIDREFYSSDRRSILKKLGIMAQLYVFGYDWRQTTDKIIPKFKEFIDNEIKGRLKAEKYIIVTHSMGGLVTRKLLQENPDMEKEVLAVIHGNQPAIGAAKFYGYFKSGAQKVNSETKSDLVGYILACITGKTAVDFQYICSDMPGSLILLPTDDYMNNKWLTWEIEDEKTRQEIRSLDGGGKIKFGKSIWDYYVESSGVLGLLGKEFFEKYPKIVESFIDNLTSARTFHSAAGLKSGKDIYAHPVTYELSSTNLNTLCGVCMSDKRFYERTVDANPRASMYADIYELKNERITNGNLDAQLLFSMEGDGTVPYESQTVLSYNTKTGSKIVNDGAEHSASYSHEDAKKYTGWVIEEILLKHVCGVTFDKGSATIKEEEKEKMERVLLAMSKDAGLRFGVCGYASDEGDSGQNKELSKKRAEALRKYLVEELAKRTNSNETECGKRFGPAIGKGVISTAVVSEEARKANRKAGVSKL